jgi:anti-anti-sigma factor
LPEVRSMEISTRKEGNALVVSVLGKMDAVTAPEFDKKFQAWTTANENAFVIDLSGLEYISSAGLRSILASAKQLKAKGGQLLFAGIKGPVKEVFELSGFYSIFRIFDSEADALKNVK